VYIPEFSIREIIHTRKLPHSKTERESGKKKKKSEASKKTGRAGIKPGNDDKHVTELQHYPSALPGSVQITRGNLS
jgi:hypothetical protein